MLWLSPSGSLYVGSGGAPFDATADELVACCCCEWYKIRLAYYDADCAYVNDGYNDSVTCACKCLIAGAVPDPIPAGKTEEDYTGYYATVDGVYQYTLSPYASEAACNAAKIEGCDVAWGCSWDTANDQPRYWYSWRLYYYSDDACTTLGMPPTGQRGCFSAAEAAAVSTECTALTPGVWYKRVPIASAANRECDAPFY